MKRSLYTIALLLLTSITIAFAEFKDLPPPVQQNLPAIQKYPQASGIFLWCRETFTLNADGSQAYEWHSFRYIPDEAARDLWGDPHVAYIEGRQTLEILAARTYTGDGRKVDCTPENAFNPIVPEGLDLAPDYSDVRQMVITLLGLENGCISELHYRLTTPKPLFPWLEGRVYLREEWPVIARELVVQVPDGVTLHYKADRGAPEPLKSGDVYTWKTGELPGYLAEDLHGHRVLLPNVAFSTARDWEQIRGELNARLAPALAEELTVPASLQKMLAGLIDDENRLDSIKAWVRSRFNRLHFHHPDFELTLRPVKQVLNSGYGNSLEIAVLVARLANLSGVKCDVVPRFVPDPPIASLHEWTDPVLGVARTPRGGYFYGDPLESRAKVSAADLEGSYLMDLNRQNEGEWFFKYTTRSKSGNSVRLSLVLDDLAGDTLHGTGTLTAIGGWGIAEGVRDHGPQDYLGSLVKLKGLSIARATVRDLQVSATVNVAVVDFEFTASALDTADGFHVLPLAVLDFTAFVKGAPLDLLRREFAQEVALPGEISLHLSAAFPESWTVERRPSSHGETWDWSEGMTRGDVKENRLTFERTLKLAREWIAPDGWSGFRAWMLATGDRSSNAVVFAPK